MTKYLRAKEDIYWDEDGLREDKFCTKGRIYQITGENSSLVSFTNDDGSQHFWGKTELSEYFYTDFKEDHPHGNWKQTISKSKFERCIQNCMILQLNTKYYNSVTNCMYELDRSGDVIRYISYNFKRAPESQKGLFETVKGHYDIVTTFKQSEGGEHLARENTVTEDLQKGVDNTSVRSDGGSTSYYQLKTIVTKDSIKELSNGNLEVSLETGDVIDMLVGGNFDLGNATKALRRIYQASLGRGKEGIDMNYDANKVNYFVKDFIRKVELKDDKTN